MEKNKVVIDADFFRHFTDVELNCRVLRTALDELGLAPVMHKYVADIELRGNSRIKELRSANYVEIIDEKSFLSENDLEDYKEYFSHAYKIANKLEVGDVDVIEYGYAGDHPGESLGEIRSIYLAKKMGYKIFMSDDGKSKDIARYVSSSKYKLEVWRAADVLVECHKNNTVIRWKDIRNIVEKGITRAIDKDKVTELYKITNADLNNIKK